MVPQVLPSVRTVWAQRARVARSALAGGAPVVVSGAAAGGGAGEAGAAGAAGAASGLVAPLPAAPWPFPAEVHQLAGSEVSTTCGTRHWTLGLVALTWTKALSVSRSLKWTPSP